MFDLVDAIDFLRRGFTTASPTNLVGWLSRSARLRRPSATWDASTLAEGLDDPSTFITENKIGYVSHNVEPNRKISWWFNAGLEQIGLLADAGIPIPTIVAGTIQPMSPSDVAAGSSGRADEHGAAEDLSVAE